MDALLIYLAVSASLLSACQALPFTVELARPLGDRALDFTAVVEEKNPDSDIFETGCTADLGFETVEVVLDRPLGERALTGCAWQQGAAGLLRPDRQWTRRG